ncbi:hypothetical protein [Sphingomonas faeni]|uniref:hypothetical protein n=1 Tax=Sphingomonas faeni TaxID=185950 RepID=UPI003345F001
MESVPVRAAPEASDSGSGRGGVAETFERGDLSFDRGIWERRPQSVDRAIERQAGKDDVGFGVGEDRGGVCVDPGLIRTCCLPRAGRRGDAVGAASGAAERGPGDSGVDRQTGARGRQIEAVTGLQGVWVEGGEQAECFVWIGRCGCVEGLAKERDGLGAAV